MKKKKILVRTATVPSTLAVFCYEQLQRLSQEYDLHIITSNGKEPDMLRKIPGITIHIVEMQRHISPMKDLVSIIKMYKTLKKIKPDIVHSVTPKAGLVTMLAAKMANVKHRIHTFTGLIWPTAGGLKKVVLKNVDSLLCFCATDIVPESFSVKNTMENGHITSKQLTILGNGSLRGIDTINFSRQADIQAIDIPNLKKNVFIFVGRIVGDKGVNELISAFDKLSKERNDVSLLLVGPRENSLDPISEQSQSCIKENKDIIETGGVTDVRPYLIKSTALILPSYREGLPNAVIEAGAMELPCIVSDIPGCNEIITAGINGIVVPVHTVTPLYEAMKQICDNPDCARQMGMNARKNVADKYDKEIVYKSLTNFYKNL